MRVPLVISSATELEETEGMSELDHNPFEGYENHKGYCREVGAASRRARDLLTHDPRDERA
jgi:hypothetical protein